MKIAICDDSSSDAECLATLCKQLDKRNSHEISIFFSATELYSRIEHSPCEFDMLFLDVDMPDMNGITLGKQIRKIAPNIIMVYSTAYPQYAIDAYDCEAFYYMVKPCNKERLQSVLDRANAKYTAAHQYHLITTKNKTLRIPINEIYFVECCHKHIIYHLAGNESIDVVDTISSVYEKLLPYGFYQVHQGYLVNFEKVYDFTDRDVVLDDKRLVMMSVRKKKEVLFAYSQYIARSL